MDRALINLAAFAVGFLLMVVAGHASATWHVVESSQLSGASACTKMDACLRAEGKTTVVNNTQCPDKAGTVRTWHTQWSGSAPNDGTCQVYQTKTTCGSSSPPGFSGNAQMTYVDDNCIEPTPTPTPSPTPEPTPTPGPCEDRDPSFAFVLEGGTGCSGGCETVVSPPDGNALYGTCIGGTCESGSYVASVTYTGASCAGEDTHEEAPQRCVTTESGREVCGEEFNSNCVTVDGERICTDEGTDCGTVNGQMLCVGDDGCYELGNGALICPSDHEPPLDENEDEVDPEAVIGDEDGDTFLFYSGGSLDDGEPGPGGPTPGPTSSPCPGGESSCGGSFSVGGRGARSFGDSVDAIGTGFKSSEFYGSASQMSEALPEGGGQCPELSLDIPFFSDTFTTDAHCQIAEENRATLAAIMFVVWGIVALWLLLRV